MAWVKGVCCAFSWRVDGVCPYVCRSSLVSGGVRCRRGPRTSQRRGSESSARLRAAPLRAALCGPARGRASGWPRPKPLRPVRRRGCPGICPGCPTRLGLPNAPRLPRRIPESARHDESMYAPPGATAPRAAPAEAALIKARRKDAAERKNWLAKNAAPLPHRVIKGGLSKKQISDVLLFPRHKHTTLNKSLVNAQRAHERDRERNRLANLQAVLDAEQKKRDAEDLQAAKDAEKKFIKNDKEKKVQPAQLVAALPGHAPHARPGPHDAAECGAGGVHGRGHLCGFAGRGDGSTGTGRGRGEAYS